MEKENYFYFGRIIKTHGNKGLLVAQIDIINKFDVFNELKFLFIEISGMLVPFFLCFYQILSKKIFLIKFDTFKIKNLIGKNIYLPFKSLFFVKDDYFSYYEIIGFQVKDIHKGFIGIIENINNKYPQAIFEIKFQNKQILIPIISSFIQKINILEKNILINSPDGLIDFYLKKKII